MSKELSMNGRKKIETIQKEFTQKFNYLTLIFLDESMKSLDVTKSLAEVRSKKGSDISIIASLKINTLEQRFLENFGIKVEVAYSRDGNIMHTNDTINKTLNELNTWCEINGCDKFNFQKALTQNTLLSVQEKLFIALKDIYQDAEAKKINKDNFLDIHLPSVNSKQGTHLFFNTAKNEIKLGFYCRDEVFVSRILKKSINIEQYAQGLRISGNPSYPNVSEAVEAAKNFLHKIVSTFKDSDNTSKSNEVKNDSSNEKLIMVGAKHSKKGAPKKYKLRYWLDTHVCYFADDYNDILNHRNDKCDQGTSWGTHSFSIELSSNNNFDFLLNEKDCKSFGINDDFNYLKYERYCDGLGTLEIQTKDPKSIVPQKVRYGLIQSIIDCDNNIFEIYNEDFCGDIVNYDSPEVDEGYFIVSGTNMFRGQNLYGRIVPEDYNSFVHIFEFYYLIFMQYGIQDADLNYNIKILSEYFENSFSNKQVKDFIYAAKNFVEARRKMDYINEIKLVASELKEERPDLISQDPHIFTDVLKNINVQDQPKLKKMITSLNRLFEKK